MHFVAEKDDIQSTYRSFWKSSWDYFEDIFRYEETIELFVHQIIALINEFIYFI